MFNNAFGISPKWSRNKRRVYEGEEEEREREREREEFRVTELISNGTGREALTGLNFHTNHVLKRTSNL